MASLVAVLADLHVNNSMAICPPVYDLDGGGKRYPNNTQKWIWRSYLDFLSKVKQAKDYLGTDTYFVFNGDLVDINTHSNYGLMSPNEADIIHNTLKVIKPALEIADYTFIVRGTEAHTGGASWFEEEIAKLVGAEKDVESGTWSWYWLQMKPEGKNGVNLGFAHHPATNSTRPYTRGNAANRQSIILQDEFWNDEEEDIPDLVSYGHFHHDEDSGSNQNIRVIYQCPWVAITGYDSRCGRASQKPKVGGNLIYVSDGKYRVKKFRYQPARRKPWEPS